MDSERNVELFGHNGLLHQMAGAAVVGNLVGCEAVVPSAPFNAGLHISRGLFTRTWITTVWAENACFLSVE